MIRKSLYFQCLFFMKASSWGPMGSKKLGLQTILGVFKPNVKYAKLIMCSIALLTVVLVVPFIIMLEVNKFSISFRLGYN